MNESDYFWSVQMEYKNHWQTCVKHLIARTEEDAIFHASRLIKETGNTVSVTGPHLHWRHRNG